MYLEQVSVVLPYQVDQCLAACRQLDLAPGPGGSRIVPFLAEVKLTLMGQPVLKTQVAVLYPSSQIVAHRDPPILGVRYHVPLQTNPGCWSFHGGLWQQLQVGHVYRMDPTELHGAVNWGSEVRLHLIVDTEKE